MDEIYDDFDAQIQCDELIPEHFEEMNDMMHDNDNTYNGWKNYETWNVNLWIQNDEGLYGFVLDGLEELLDRYGLDWENISLAELEELVQEAFGANKTPDGVSLFSDEIDWDEIADALLELAEGNNLQVRNDNA
jgi:hypothetical protein